MPDTTVDTLEAEAATEMLSAMKRALEGMHFSDLDNDEETRLAALNAILDTDISLSPKEAYEWATEVNHANPFARKAEWFRAVKAMKKFYHAPYTPTPGVTNFLTVDEKDKSLPAQDRFFARLAAIAKKEAQPLAEGDDDSRYYGWVDDEARNHFLPFKDDCSFAEITNIVEDEWDEFVNTFAGPEDGHVTGFQADAKCACGYWSGRVRWEGSFGTLLDKVVGRNLN